MRDSGGCGEALFEGCARGVLTAERGSVEPLWVAVEFLEEGALLLPLSLEGSGDGDIFLDRFSRRCSFRERRVASVGMVCSSLSDSGGGCGERDGSLLVLEFVVVSSKSGNEVAVAVVGVAGTTSSSVRAIIGAGRGSAGTK